MTDSNANAIHLDTVVQDALKVMTLNLAHGRKNAWHQAFLKRRQIEAHLNDVAEVICRERPDVIALQEADGPSIWSGRFDHVAHLAERAEMPCFVRGEHVRRLKLCYGTALLSRHPLEDSVVRTFAPSPLTLPKGFVVASLRWSGEPQREVDVASVHLDFSRRSVRRRQVEEIVRLMSGRDRPRVLMGDLNCEAGRREGTIRELSSALSLKLYRSEATGMDTFPLRRKRFDWILISRELEFHHHATLPDVLSDHRAVVASVRVGNRRAHP